MQHGEKSYFSFRSRLYSSVYKDVAESHLILSSRDNIAFNFFVLEIYISLYNIFGDNSTHPFIILNKTMTTAAVSAQANTSASSNTKCMFILFLFSFLFSFFIIYLISQTKKGTKYLDTN